jgi:hypothetical protein
MALQSSGALSFANLQTEFGGSHPITMGEYSSYSGIGATSEVSLSDFYGLSASVDTQIVTVGTKTVFNTAYIGFAEISVFYSWGSIDDGDCAFKSEANIQGIYKVDDDTNDWHDLYFILDGQHANSGFVTMTVNSNNYTRLSATWAQTASTTYWKWGVGSTNPFGVTSGNKTVTWT